MRRANGTVEVDAVSTHPRHIVLEPHDCNFRDDIGCINDRCPLHRAMRALARCLRDAAACERAFSLGVKYADDLWDVDGKRWRSGSLRRAP